MHEDYQLISLLKKGDERAIKGFYQQYKPEFFLFAKKYEIAAESILDIYQDAVIALCENAKKGKLDDLNSSLKTYFFAIGKYMIFAKLKKENKTVSFEEIHDFHIEWETETDDDSEKEIDTLRTVLKKMGGQCQHILTLFYYEEKKLEEITTIMNYENKDVAKSQKARCLKKLKELIKFES